MTTQTKNKVTTTKQVTEAVKSAATAHKTKAVKTGYQFNYQPAVISTADVLKTGLYALPASGTIKPRNIEPLVLGHKVDVIKLGTFSPAKPKTARLNAYGNSKGYGDRWPTEGTSAYAIWTALVLNEYNINQVTKIWVDKLAEMNLECNKGIVNPNNLSIEINSFKRYLINHNLVTAPAKAA